MTPQWSAFVDSRSEAHLQSGNEIAHSVPGGVPAGRVPTHRSRSGGVVAKWLAPLCRTGRCIVVVELGTKLAERKFAGRSRRPARGKR